MASTSVPGVPGDLGSVQPTAGEDAHTIMINRVSWGAIFAGVVVGLVVQVLLTMLGIGIGVATLDPTGGSPAASTFSIASGIWYVVSGIIAAYAGGYIAARMSGKTVATTGALHGLTAWAFTTLLVLYLLSTAVGGIVGGAFSGVAGAIGGVGQTVAQAAGPMLADANPLDALQNQIRATGNDPEALNTTAMNAMRRWSPATPPRRRHARQQAAQALANARGIPLDQAQQQVAQMEEQYRQAVDQAKQMATQAAADTAASVVSTGALLAFVALVLGADRRLARGALGCRASGLRRSHDPDPPSAGVTHGPRGRRPRPSRSPRRRSMVSVREAVTGRVRVSTTTETFEEVVRQELRGMRAEVVRCRSTAPSRQAKLRPGLGTRGGDDHSDLRRDRGRGEAARPEGGAAHHPAAPPPRPIEVPVELRRQRAIVERLPGAEVTQSSPGENDG